jgi:Fe-S cluster assembly iron-binding protein IscA
MLNQLKFYERAYLAIGYYTEGPDIGKRYLEVIMKYDANLERCYESNGVRIVLRVDQIHRFTGAVLDYVDLLEKFNLRFPYGNPDTGLT